MTRFQTLIDNLDFIDKTIYEYIFIYANPEWLTAICSILVKSATFIPFILVFLFIYARKHSMKDTLILVASTALLLGISESTASLLKELFERPRPVYQMGIYISEGGYSFPSAHSVNTMAFAVFWAFRMKQFSHWFFSMSIIVGFSRLLTNYHFPGDILAGWITGFVVGYLFVLAFRRLENYLQNRPGTKTA